MLKHSWSIHFGSQSDWMVHGTTLVDGQVDSEFAIELKMHMMSISQLSHHMS
jgi:hypothetical protein